MHTITYARTVILNGVYRGAGLTSDILFWNASSRWALYALISFSASCLACFSLSDLAAQVQKCIQVFLDGKYQDRPTKDDPHEESQACSVREGTVHPELAALTKSAGMKFSEQCSPLPGATAAHATKTCLF